MPTSTTTAPGFTCLAPISPALPTATISRSGRRARVISSDRVRRHAGVGRVPAARVAALLADLLVGPQVLGRELFIGLMVVGPEQHPAVGVEGDAASDVGMIDDEMRQVACLWL